MLKEDRKFLFGTYLEKVCIQKGKHCFPHGLVDDAVAVDVQGTV